MRIRVGHLYPDYLNIYADRGNIAVLAERARQRGHELEVQRDRDAATRCRSARSTSSTSAAARTASRRSSRRISSTKAEPLARGGRGGRGVPRGLRRLPAARPLLSGCGGSDLPGIGLLPLHTVAGQRRMIGDVLLDCAWAGQTLAGFENHAGRTILDEGAEPLGRVVSGFGNDGASAATRVAAGTGSTAPTSTGRCCRATRGSPTTCWPRRSPTPAAPTELAPLPDELETKRTGSPPSARERAAASSELVTVCY